jgi:hypothetical protein
MIHRARAVVKVKKHNKTIIMVVILILLGLFLLSRTRQVAPYQPQRALGGSRAH